MNTRSKSNSKSKPKSKHSKHVLKCVPTFTPFRRVQILEFLITNEKNNPIFKNGDWKKLFISKLNDKDVTVPDLNEWIKYEGWIQTRANHIANGVVNSSIKALAIPPSAMHVNSTSKLKRKPESLAPVHVQRKLRSAPATSQQHVPSPSVGQPKPSDAEKVAIPPSAMHVNSTSKLKRKRESLAPVPVQQKFLSAPANSQHHVPSTSVVQPQPDDAETVADTEVSSSNSQSQSKRLRFERPNIPCNGPLALLEDAGEVVLNGLFNLESVLRICQVYDDFRACIPSIKGVYQAFQRKQLALALGLNVNTTTGQSQVDEPKKNAPTSVVNVDSESDAESDEDDE